MPTSFKILKTVNTCSALMFALVVGLVTACGGSGNSKHNAALTLANLGGITSAEIDDLLDQIPGSSSGLNPDFSIPSIRSLEWPVDFPADLQAGLTDTVLVTGLPTQTAYDFDVTLPGSVGEDTTLFVLNLSEDHQMGGAICYGDPDCTGTVTLGTVSLQLVSFDTDTASIAISPSSTSALVNEGSSANPQSLVLSGSRLSYNGTVGATRNTASQLINGESFYRLSGMSAGNRYEVALTDTSDNDLEMAASYADGTDVACDPSYSNATRCVLVAKAGELDLHVEGNGALFGASFILQVNEVSKMSAFEGSWNTPLPLLVPGSETSYYFGRADNYSSYYKLSDLDPQRRYRILLSGNDTFARLKLNSPLTSLPVYAPQCAAVDEDDSAGEQVCIIENAVNVYFRVESVNESSQYLLSVEASLPDEGTPTDPLTLQLDEQSRLLHQGTVNSNSFYKIQGLSAGQKYLLQTNSEHSRLEASLTTSSTAEVDCYGSFHNDCVFTVSEEEVNLTVADTIGDIGGHYILSVVPTDAPNRMYPEPASEDIDLDSSMLPFAGKVGSYYSNYTVTGLEPYGKYLVTISENSERMSLSSWPGAGPTIQCTVNATHPFGTGCTSNADGDGVINMRIGGDDAGGQFTIDVIEAQLTADYLSNDTPLSIPDNSNPGAVSTINIGDNKVVEIVEVVLQVDHGYAEDLEITLEAPNGQRVTLSDHVPGVDFGYSIFSDLSALSNAGAITSGLRFGLTILKSYRPDGLLYKLNGVNRSGSWTLHVADSVYTNRSDAFGGRLLGWGLRFSTLAE